jgi:short-subunit dehydrogenase
MASREVIVLVGGTSTLAKALVDRYLSTKNIARIIITARSKEKFDSLYSSYSSEDIEFYELDVLNLIDIEKLVSYVKKYERKVVFHYLAAVKHKGSRDVENLFKINFLSSIYLYDILLKKIDSFNFILIGSQGDIHGTYDTSSYNASKAAMSNYFEPIALSNKGTQQVFVIKPWLFQSKIITSSQLTNLLTYSPEYIAKVSIKKIAQGKSLIYIPAFTYKLVELLSFINKKLLYAIVLRFFKR